MQKVRIGILGCGRISNTYITNITEKFSDTLEIVACSDLIEDVAQSAASKCLGSRAISYEEMLANDEVEVVLNLTNSWAHYETSRQALEAGKHVYSEKTLTLDREQAHQLVSLAKHKNLLIGGAPDTFMGAGMQGVRELIDNGELGKIYYVNTFIGMNASHPNYASKRHGGMLFDMGPYYVAGLVNLFGPVKRVSGISKKLYEKRTFGDQEFEVEIPSTSTAVLEFESGVLANFTTSSDTIYYIPKFEIFGTLGNISANDPNHFSGEIKVQYLGKDVETIPITHPFESNYRGIGLVDMARVLRAGAGAGASGESGKFRANGEMACHLVDVLQSVWKSSDTGRAIDIKYSCERPASVPIDGKLG